MGLTTVQLCPCRERVRASDTRTLATMDAGPSYVPGVAPIGGIAESIRAFESHRLVQRRRAQVRGGWPRTPMGVCPASRCECAARSARPISVMRIALSPALA